MSTPSATDSLTVLMPVLDDWESARLLIAQLDEALAGVPGEVNVLLVDDGSRTPPPARFPGQALNRIERVDRLQLRRNLGHQRAIAVGLSHLFDQTRCTTVVVMDADGEDKAEDVPRLLTRFGELEGKVAVFAARARRSESLVFRMSYQCYRQLHRLLTGIPVRVGNFSVLSRTHLSSLVVVSDLWNHYAASVVKSRLPMETVPLARGLRLAGVSKLNFVGLAVHGLSAISVFAEIVGVRLILATSVGIALFVGALIGIFAVRYGLELALPTWTLPLAALLLILVLQALTVASGLTLAILFNRNNLSFLPIRDYQFFVGSVSALHERPA